MKIPISLAKEVCEKTNSKQVIIFTWDGENQNIATYGKSVEDCSQAADGGNMMKELLGWPKCNDQPSRVKKLQNRIKELEKQIKENNV